MDFRLQLAQEAVLYAEKEVNDWLEARKMWPGLQSFRPQKERILNMNLQAARERLSQILTESPEWGKIGA